MHVPFTSPTAAAAAGPPAPFKLSTSPGDTSVTLTRDYKGEAISVDARYGEVLFLEGG
jgi:hypothetical protein